MSDALSVRWCTHPDRQARLARHVRYDERRPPAVVMTRSANLNGVKRCCAAWKISMAMPSPPPTASSGTSRISLFRRRGLDSPLHRRRRVPGCRTARCSSRPLPWQAKFVGKGVARLVDPGESEEQPRHRHRQAGLAPARDRLPPGILQLSAVLGRCRALGAGLYPVRCWRAGATIRGKPGESSE